MRLRLKRTKLLFALIPIISIAFYILTANNNIYADQGFTEFDIYQITSTSSKPVDGKTPEDYTAAENFAIAAQVYLDTDCVQSTQNGSVTAMGFYKQTVMNYRCKRDGQIFSESISLSAIASVAEQRYFKDKALLYRKGEAKGGAVKSWSDTITELSVPTYRQRYGVVPQEICKYAVNEASVKSGKFVSKNADGTYTYELVLNPDEAYRFARYEMMTYAGVTSFPEYLTCRLVFTMDPNWVMREIKSYDTYKIDLMNGVKCDSTLTETYTYEKDFMPERAQKFIDYVPTGATGDISTGKSPSDYLNEAYGDYISGKPLKIDAQVSILGDTFPLKAVIDIGKADYRFTLGDLYGCYTDGNVYLKAGDNALKLDTADLNDMVSMPEIGLSDDILDTLFENYTISESDTHITINMPFNLFGCEFKVNMGLLKQDDGSVTADTIDATVAVNAIKIKVKAQTVDELTLPAPVPSEYEDIKPLISAAVKTAEQNTLGLSGNLSVNYNGTLIELNDLSAKVIKGENNEISAQASFKVYGIDARATYLNDTLYLESNGIKIKSEIADLNEIMSSFDSLLPELPSLSTKEILNVLPGGISLNTVIKLLKSASYDGNRLVLDVTPYNGGNWTLTVTHGEMLTGVSLHGLKAAGIVADADLYLVEADESPITVSDEEYVYAQDITPLIPVAQELITAQSYTLDIQSATVQIKNGQSDEIPSADLSGTVTLNRDLSAAQAELTVTLKEGQNTLTVPLSVKYVNKEIYLISGDFAASGTVADLTSLLGEFGIQIPEFAPGAGDMDLSAILAAITLGSNNGSLELGYTAGEYGITVKPNAVTDNGINLTVKCEGGINAEATVGLMCGEKTEVTPIDRDYLKLSDLLPFVTPVNNVVNASSFNLTVNGLMMSDEQSETISANVSISKGVASGSIVLSGQTIDFAMQDGKIYLRAGNIAVKADLADTEKLLRFVYDILGDAKVLVGNISPYTGESKANKIINVLGKVQNITEEFFPFFSAETTAEKVRILLDTSVAKTLLPELSHKGITELLASVRIDGNNISATVNPENGSAYNLSAASDGEIITSVSVTDVSLMGIAAGFTADITYGGESKRAISAEEEANYVDIAEITKHQNLISDLMQSKAFEVTLLDGNLNTSVISGGLSGSIRINLYPLAVQAELTLRTHRINLTYAGGEVLLCINDIRLTFALSDIGDLIAEIKKYTGSSEVATVISEAVQSAGLIENALGMPLNKLISGITTFTESEEGLVVALNISGANINAVISGDDKLTVKLTDSGFDGYIYNSSITLQISAIPAFTAEITSEAKADYVSLQEIKTYIAPVMQSVSEENCHITFEGSVLAADNQTTSISGELKTERTGSHLGDYGFLNIYAHIVLSGRTGDQDIEVYLIDGTDYEQYDDDGELIPVGFDVKALIAYINYTGFKARVDYSSVLGIIGSLCEILDLDIPMLQDLIGDTYVPTGTTVFETMDIAGLDSIRKTILDMFNVAEDVSDATQEGADAAGLTALISDELIDNLLGGISLGFDEDKMLSISLDNGIFTLTNSGKYATITLGHNSERLKYVSILNLIANGDTVNFTASINYDKSDIIPPADALDLSSLDSLLYSVIKTADLRNFHIKGNIKLSVPVISDPVIPFDIKVKILDDGSTVAAVKLEVPFVSAIVAVGLTRTDSYIYFVNNRLYFVVDVWSSWIWGEGSYKTTEIKSATVEEFLSNPMEYLFFLLRMADIIKSPITDAMQNGGSGEPGNISDIIKNYSYDGNNFNFKIGLAELAGSSDLSDLNLTLNTNNNIITGLSVDTKFVNTISLSLNNTTLSNLIYEDGLVVGANPLEPVSYGKAYTGNQFSKNIDKLEDDLAIIFPVDAAETFAEKANLKAEKASKAAKALDETNKEIESLQDELTKAIAEHDSALAKLKATPEGAFGYERLQAQEKYLLKAEEDARKDLAEAKQNRLTKAASAVAAASTAYDYAVKAANAATKTLSYQSSVRSYAASGSAAMAAVNAINQSYAALEAASNAAELAGESGAAVKELAKTEKEEIDATVKSTARLASEAASIACTRSVNTVTTAAEQAASAQAESSWFTASEKADETLKAINAMTIADAAARQAAKISADENTIAVADQNAITVKNITESAAITAATAATAAANNIAANGKLIADSAATLADNGNADGSYDKTAEALTYLRAANAAAKTANAAVELLQGDWVSDSQEIDKVSSDAADAAQFCKQSATYIGNTVLVAANKAIELYSAAITNAQNSLSGAQSIAASLEKIVTLMNYSSEAKQYAQSKENNALLVSSYVAATAAANSALDKAHSALFDAATVNRSNAQTKKQAAYNTSTKNDAYSDVEKSANALTTVANENTRISVCTATIIKNANAVYAKSSALLTTEQTDGIRQAVALSLGNDGSDGEQAYGYKGVYEQLRNGSSDCNDGAKHMAQLASNLREPLIFKDGYKKSQEACSTLSTDANKCTTACADVNDSINNLLAFINQI